MWAFLPVALLSDMRSLQPGDLARGVDLAADLSYTLSKYSKIIIAHHKSGTTVGKVGVPHAVVHLGCISAISRLYLGCISAVSRLYLAM